MSQSLVMVLKDYLSPLLLLISITWIFTLIILNSRARKPSNLPPGPFPLPIIGNILLLGPKPHQSLAKLSREYGPVMSLKLGTITTIVISSPKAARSVLQKHDLAFSSRKIPVGGETLGHDVFSMVWHPVDEQWRKLRKICREQMFSGPRLDSGQGPRREKLGQLRGYVKSCRDSGRAVDVGEAAFTTALNLMSATLFSEEFVGFGSGSSREIRDVVWGVMRAVGRPNLADFFPVLKRVDPQGIRRDAEYYFGRLFEIFDRIIDDKLRCRGDNIKDDLLEALIELHLKGELSRDDIKHLLLDLFTAGTDTSSSTVEWAMAELLRNPSKLSTLRNEINDVINGVENDEESVQEPDIPRLPYLQAVVKETLRLHPPGPFLVPHKANADVEVIDYIVPKDAQVLVNVWASGRDPNVWPDAEVFSPERFLGRDVDYRGKDFELIPFGAGRRICPGLPLAHRMIHLMLATLVGGFEWRIEGGVESEVLDMEEKFGLTLQKAVPLRAVPVA
ncbi:cytochrome P450- family 76- subfamily C-polypeptide 7 [Striga hermonthica]|uniref:Cytochrome P450- family 76- subfamily C-polypeptide 7 n=1 Tax=Striga hermonthica TaxID=68872 RepID=A0A9N7RSX4_STRHE|nr:cytochrome P450- family 76- subfamily C-polypeptide 7 [Striga hermonthica]